MMSSCRWKAGHRTARWRVSEANVAVTDKKWVSDPPFAANVYRCIGIPSVAYFDKTFVRTHTLAEKGDVGELCSPEYGTSCEPQTKVVVGHTIYN